MLIRPVDIKKKNSGGEVSALLIIKCLPSWFMVGRLRNFFNWNRLKSQKNWIFIEEVCNVNSQQLFRVNSQIPETLRLS